MNRVLTLPLTLTLTLLIDHLPPARASVLIEAQAEAQAQEPAAGNLPQAKTVARLRATLPDYKGPSRMGGRRALILFSADGQTIAISGTERTVKLWDAKTARLKATLKGESREGFDAFAFSPDGRTIATRDFIDKTVKLWDVATAQLKITLAGRKKNFESKFKAGLSATLNADITPVSFSPDGQMILTERNDDVVDLWEASTGKLKATLEHDTRSNAVGDALSFVFSTMYVLSMQPTFSPDGRRIVTVNGDKAPKLWDTETGRLRATLTGSPDRVYRAVFSRDSRTVATTTINGFVNLWDAETGQLKGTLGKKDKDTALGFEFSPDSRTAVTFLKRDTQLWDVEGGKLKWTLPKSKATDAAFSPDGRTVATASDDKRATAKLWDTETGELRRTLAPSVTKANSIGYSPNGRIIVTTSDKGVSLWDAANGELLDTLSEARYPATFSPDGQELATGGRNDTAMLWEIVLKQ
jgi:WD40 repeat protein